MICENYIEDTERRGSYIAEVANIAAPRFPVRVSKLVLVVGFTADPGDEYRLTMHDARGKLMIEMASEVAGAADASHPLVISLRKLRMEMAPLEFTKEGQYEFRFWDMKKRKVVARRRIAVVLASPKDDPNDLG